MGRSSREGRKSRGGPERGANLRGAGPDFSKGLRAGLSAGGFSAAGFSKLDAAQKALAQISGGVNRQALVMSYVNAFWLMSVIVACLVPVVFIMRNPTKAEEKASAGAH